MKTPVLSISKQCVANSFPDCRRILKKDAFPSQIKILLSNSLLQVGRCCCSKTKKTSKNKFPSLSFDAGFVSNFDEFTKRLPEENKFTPMGSKIHSYTRENEDGVEYEVYHVCWWVWSPLLSVLVFEDFNLGKEEYLRELIFRKNWKNQILWELNFAVLPYFWLISFIFSYGFFNIFSIKFTKIIFRGLKFLWFCRKTAKIAKISSLKIYSFFLQTLPAPFVCLFINFCHPFCFATNSK